MKRTLTLSAAFTAIATTMVLAHCQIPCGIYGDATRFDLMREHVATIEKSMQSITELSAGGATAANQLTRWVINKEDHADELTEIVTSYFMAQRVKPADKANTEAYAAYQEKLTILHGMIVNAMKAKQTTDLEYCAKLRQGIDTFEMLYMGKKAADK